MKKEVWVISNCREELIEAQRRINEGGSLRAVCLVSEPAVERVMEGIKEAEGTKEGAHFPSLIIADYETGSRNGFLCLKRLQAVPAFAGIPLFFMAAAKTREIDEECYGLGATVVLRKPFSDASLLRIERAAWQHEMTRNYEKMLQHQAAELAAAKEIRRLNSQLEARNALLYQIFGKYFSDEVVDLILDEPEGAAIGGQKREVTVMMADLRGFTSMSDRLDADVVTAILNHFLEEMTNVIMEHEGTIIEIIGDSILAVFGAPLPCEAAKENAVIAAIEMQNRMRMVNQFNQNNGYPDLQMGIGMHSGEVFIGNIGSEKLMRYNVIGQAVNLCSRIESYSVGGQILASREMLDTMKGHVKTDKTFSVSMKGIHEQIMVEEVVEITCTCARKDSIPDSGEDAEERADVAHAQAEEIIYRLERDSEEPLCSVCGKRKVTLYALEDKHIVEKSLQAQIIAYSKTMVCLSLSASQVNRLEEYMDMELVVGTENAYAKLVEKNTANPGEILLRFTYLSEGFLSDISAGESGR